MGKETYGMNVIPRRPSRDHASNSENLWALRVFKQVDSNDGAVSKIVASSGLTYVTVSCEFDCTALELCQILMRKFTSNRDLTKFRLYLSHHGTEKLLSHDDHPVLMLVDILKNIGYNDSDQLSKIVREDHSYCCRFMFREYPPPPPRSEDFVDSPNCHSVRITPSRSSASLSQFQNRARITSRAAYLADVNLSVIPTVMFLNAKTIEHVDLSRNTLLVLPEDLFEMLVNLKLLRLIGNLLETIPKAILSCPSITHLDLSSNFLSGETLKVLADMPNLTHLNISCNKIETIPEELAALKSLKILDVSSNYLRELPPCIWMLSNLRELNASFNKISQIPKGIGRLSVLKTLILVGNSIQSIDETIRQLPNLRHLDLRGNLLVSAHEVGQVTSLQELSLDHNMITKINEAKWSTVINLSCKNNSLTSINIAESLEGLRRLELSYSKLVSIPDVIFEHLPNLVELYLHHNDLIKIPSSVDSLSKLEKLVASHNSITDINLRFARLSNLSQVELHTNNIRSITEEIWNAEALRVLNISSNFLTGFPLAPISLDALPLSKSLEELLAADNRLADDIGDVISLLTGLRVLNLSYNRVFDLGDSLKTLEHLVELYLSGNGMTAFPDDIDRCQSLRMLFINGNKLANIPGELGKGSLLAVFDAQSNMLKYNVTNWPYDWNWNFNVNLQYLNLSNNKRLEIRTSTSSTHNNLTNFKSMHKLRLLDLSNVQVASQCLPESVINLQTRLMEDQAGLFVAVADYCGRDIQFDIAEFVSRSFMGQEKDHLVALFDGRGSDFVSSYLKDTIEDNLKMELRRIRQGEEFCTAIRRAFLATNRDYSIQPFDLHQQHQRGCTACLLYLLENQLIIANVGDTMAVLSREGTAEVLTVRHHPWARAEQARIRELGGYISLQGLVEGDLPITRAFGYHHLLPYVNANPTIKEVILRTTDEFVLVATWSFWRVMSYQMAVDVARRERNEPHVAVQKLRDLAIARGVTESMKIIFVDFRGITTQVDVDAPVVERRRTAFRRDNFDDQVLSRLPDEITPPKPPCAFVFTDIKDSTKLWSMLPTAMRAAIKQHNDKMRRQMRIHGGYEVKTEGDAFVVAFQNGINALRFCLAVQEQFLTMDWPREILDSPVASPFYSTDGKLLYKGLSIRMGVHYGMADDEEDKVARRMDYHGIHMIIAARVSALADGGQINVTQTIMNMVLDLPDIERPEMTVFDLGMTNLKGLPHPEHLYAVYPGQLTERHRLRSDSIRSIGSNSSGNPASGELPLASQLSMLSVVSNADDSTSEA